MIKIVVHVPYSPDLVPLSYAIATWARGNPPVFTCPNGHTSVLVDHTVNEDGSVNESFDCPDCDYREFILLAEWSNHRE